ncbi:MAG TPA: hypothetical protein VK668_20530 [Mucilaginibacter sp.]|nr:hypothetical protein [Mucilaginibacter sp.]
MPTEEEIISKASEHIGLDVNGPQGRFKQPVVIVTKSSDNQFYTWRYEVLFEKQIADGKKEWLAKEIIYK